MIRCLVVLLASCGAMPDEVAVSTFASEFDYLGGDNLKGLGSETGQNTGVMVTGTYRLRPTQVQLLPSIGSRPVPSDLQAEPAIPDIEDAAKQLGAQAVQAVQDAGQRTITQAVGDLLRMPSDVLDDYAARVQWAMIAGTFVICVIWMLLQRRRKR